MCTQTSPDLNIKTGASSASGVVGTMGLHETLALRCLGARPVGQR
jgi:hypothetical protein